MAQTKVIEFKNAKNEPQFDVLEEVLDDNIIRCVRRIKDGAFFYLNQAYVEMDANSHLTHCFKITHFDRDLINVAYELATDLSQEDGEMKKHIINKFVGPINDIKLGFCSTTFIIKPEIGCWTLKFKRK